MNSEAQMSVFFFFNDTATTEIYTLSLHDALPIYGEGPPPAAVEVRDQRLRRRPVSRFSHPHERAHDEQLPEAPDHRAERGADAPQPDAERDHGPPRLEVAQHAERQRGERQDDHVRRAEPAEPLIGEG